MARHWITSRHREGERERYRRSVGVAIRVEELYTDGEVAAGSCAIHEFRVYIEVIYIVRGHTIPA
jgi:hypothetical protein